MNNYSFKTLTLLLAVLAAMMLITSCDNDDDAPTEPPNEEEVITSLTMTFSGGGVAIFTWIDADGEGPAAPVITEQALQANTTYTVDITLLNTLEMPAENITEEIAEEDDEHQFFFETSAGLDLDIAYADMDDDGNPLGLRTTFTTGAAGTGTVKVTLRHEPTKGITYTPGGAIPSGAGGSTDIEVTFDVEIQ
ncbi:MAG: type 1 periplasmic binding fold superfamily protein [Bacteroidota bacterium]